MVKKRFDKNFWKLESKGKIGTRVNRVKEAVSKVPAEGNTTEKEHLYINILYQLPLVL